MFLFPFLREEIDEEPLQERPYYLVGSVELVAFPEWADLECICEFFMFMLSDPVFLKHLHQLFTNYFFAHSQIHSLIYEFHKRPHSILIYYDGQ